MFKERQRLILLDFLERLDQAQTFDECFAAFSSATQDLGFEGAVYSFIPSPVLQQIVSFQPVFKSSGSYCPKFLQHYADAGFDKQDFTIKSILKGSLQPMDWWAKAKTSLLTEPELEVIETAKVDYGLKNGISIPTLSSEMGIAGASFINRDGAVTYKKLLSENLAVLRIITRTFSDRIVSDPSFSVTFLLPIFENCHQENAKCCVTWLPAGL
ncbi:MAG: hypothetical protein HC808_07990 [Candidatus Competibacteraceae bacterium]|nr:hypothetical protein [Candidatus Competibacteraceae bacterium]